MISSAAIKSNDLQLYIIFKVFLSNIDNSVL